MYNCLIVEDEDYLSEALQLMLERVAPGKITVMGVAKRVAQAIHLIDTLRPSVVFMDINLKDGDAFYVLDHIQHREFHLVFTTAFEEHAMLAFRYRAVDYLLKPIGIPMLEEVLRRIERVQNQYIPAARISRTEAGGRKMPDTIPLSTQEGIHVVPARDIIRCETSGSYTTFFLTDRRHIIVARSLTSFDEFLYPPFFLRVHHSHLVNVSKIKLYEKKGLLIMADDTTVPVARSKKDAVMATLGL